MTHPIVEGLTEAVTMAKLMRENDTQATRIAELEAEVAELKEIVRILARSNMLLDKSLEVAIDDNDTAWEAGRDAAAAKAESHPMRFAGMTEEFVRKEMSAAIRSLRR